MVQASYTKLAAPASIDVQPLVYGLECGAVHHTFELIRDIPSRCALRLQNGEAQLALIPSIAYAKHYVEQSYRIAAGAGASSSGEVKSALLCFNQGLNHISAIAVDIGSVSEIVLARILLSEKYDLQPQFLPMVPDVKAMLDKADGALVIGDAALFEVSGYVSKLDLGEEWQELTDLPFVYSFWVGREGTLRAEEIEWLRQSKQFGIEKIPEIAEREAQTHGVDVELCRSHLTDISHYDLGEDELEGLREFYRFAFYYGAIEDIPDLRFFEA